MQTDARSFSQSVARERMPTAPAGLASREPVSRVADNRQALHTELNKKGGKFCVF